MRGLQPGVITVTKGRDRAAASCLPLCTVGDVPDAQVPDAQASHVTER